MGAESLLAELRAQGFGLREVEGRLRLESPPGQALSAEQRSEIGRLRDDLLALLRASARIPTARRDGLLPVSVPQRRLWYLESTAESGPPAYQIPTLLRLRGPLDRAALQRALDALVERHEALRSAVVTLDGRPWQRVLPPAPVPLPLEEITEAALPERIVALALEPFDLAAGRLLRARLLRLAPRDHVLLLLQHHIVSDGWSVELLARELGRLYGGETLPPPLLQYGDYAAWQAAALDEGRLQALLEAWLPRLQGCPVLELPTDKRRPAVLGNRGGHVHVTIPEATTAALKRLAAARRTTLFAVLLAAFKLLLLRYSGQRDFAVGTPVANRPHEDLAGVAGFFVNILVLRSDLAGVEDIPTLIERVDETLHHALSHQDLPFDRLVTALGLERDAARPPLFQALFALQTANRETAPPFAGLETELTVEADYPVAKAELTFSLQERAGALALRVEWNEDLFAAATAARMAEHYRRLLQGIAARPEARLAELPLLDGAEYRALVLQAGRNPRAYPRDATLTQLFRAQAARTPDLPAIDAGDRVVTYRALADATARLARLMDARAGGIERGASIALCMERSVDFVVAVLACVELGAVYVPIDPAYPPARQQMLLEGTRPALAVADGEPPSGYPWVSLARDRAEIEAQSPAPLGRPGSPEDAAYVSYTSGTTGRPKGVVVPQRGVIRLVVNCDYLDFRPGLRMTYGSNVAFDPTTLELWGPLLNGGCMVLLDQDALLDAERLQREIEERHIDLVWLVTAHMEQLAEQRPQTFRRAEVLAFGGSAVSPAILRRILAEPSGRPRLLMNGYGPTENTTFSAVHLFDEVGEELRSIPIGKPIANSTVYILSPEGQPQPVGVPGELFTGGDGVALGYLGQPELTAERFLTLRLAHPQVPEGAVEDRVYRTGDIVRWRPDGLIEFLGRRDDQVKLRSFRIELSEVEAALQAQPGVAKAVVRVQQGPPRPQLVAWYSSDDPAVTPERLRGALGVVLPGYMVPTGLLRMAAWPLNPHGKIDLAALPPVPLAGEAGAGDAPQGEVETALARIWQELLRLPRIGRDQGFFALGGDSILGIQVVARARAAGLSITPRQLFEAGTLARLAPLVRRRGPSLAGGGWRPEPIPPTPIQEWFFQLELPRPNHFNQALLLLLPDRWSAELLSEALSRLTARHEGLRLRFTRTASGWEQRALPPEPQPVAVQGLDLSAILPDAQAEAIAEACTAWQRHLDPGTGPLLAAGLVEGHADGRQRLFLAAHHLVVDGVSWRILLDELQRIRQGGDDALPAGGTDGTLRAWGEALAAYAALPATAAQRDFWLEAARDAAFLPATAAPQLAATQPVAHLSAQATRDLLQRAVAASGASLDELLLTALAAALRDWSGGRRFVVGLEGHGREELVAPLDLSDTVGWFTSLYPVALELPGEAGWDALLAAVKARLRAVPDKGLGFSALRYLAQEPALAALPRPALTFNYLGRLEGEGWRLAPETPGRMVAAENGQPHPLELTALVTGGVLEARLAVAAGARLPGPAAALLQGFLAAVEALVGHCLSAPARRSPADYPLAGLDQAALDAVLTALPAPPERLYPLTPLQEGLLFHALHSPDSDQYLVQLFWEMEGDLDPGRLQAAWAETLSRHDSLRARFLWRGLARPLQAVEAAVPLPWRELDWRGDPDPAAHAATFLAEDRARGFDLAQPCPMRLTLIRLAERRWRFVWSQHHIVLDGWCLSLLLGEVAQRYRRLGGEGPALPEAPPPFERYLAWLAAQDRDEARAFWRAALAGIEGPTDLAFRRPGTTLEGNAPIRRLEQLAVPLPPDLERRLEALARGCGVTSNAVLQLAWGLLLARTSGQDDVVHGTTLSGRAGDLPGVERMIGLTINSLPLRLRLDPAQPVRAALAETNRLVQEVNHRSWLPLSEVQAASAVPAGQPLFHSLLIFENYPAEGLAGAGVLRPLGLDIREKTSYPLLLMAIPGERLLLRLDYDADLFEAPAIRRAAGHLLHLLDGLAAAPEAPLGSLSLLTAAEESALAGWQGETVPLPETTVTALIEAQAARTPDGEAARFEGAALSYRALDEAANRLAHLLRARHLALTGRPFGADTPVALRLERGLGMIVAILGVLKAGGAWLPLDLEHPEARLAEMLEDSRAPLTIVGEGGGTGLVALDDPALAAMPATRPEPLGGPDGLAYVIFTSGSTGRPKGVASEHRGLVNRLLWMQDRYPIGPGDRVLQKTPYSFDVSVWEFLWPLLTGATLVFARPGGHRDPGYLARLVAEEAITTLHFVPSMLQAFAERPELPRLTGLRQMFCSGEALPTALAAKVLAALPGLALHNLYGPTEASIDVSWHRCRPEDAAEGAVVPIGRPVWNTELQVLDAALRPLPVGVPGELWLGGVQLARGYLNRPELTAERFVTVAGRRLYRSGDLVRRRPDGALDYLGRADFQVKIRGQRIELGEIEAALEAQPGIRQACVLARGQGGDTLLVAYHDGRPQDPAALRAALAGRLPEAMLPSAFVHLEAFPLTTSGKIDRKALPEPELGGGRRTGETAARDPLEASVAQIFAEVLGLPAVGPEEDFFALGGHSLKATQVASRLLARLGAELPLRDLFAARTARGLAPRVAAALRGSEAPLRPVAAGAPQPLSFAQERLWFLQRFAAQPALYNVPTLLRLRGELDVGALAAALDGWIAAHGVLRIRLLDTPEGPRQAVLPPAAPGLAAEPLDPAALEERLAADSRRPFALTEEAPVRLRLYRLAPEDHVLAILQHHVVTDGWSLGLMLTELTQRYADALAGRPQAPGRQPDYFAFVAWQRSAEAAERRARDLAYWSAALAGLQPLELPADRPRPPVQSHRGALAEILLEAPLAAAVRQTARALGATPFTLLLAAFKAVLARWSGQTDVAVGTPIANRQRLELEAMQGLFVNTLVLRDRVDEAASFADLVRGVTETALAAYTHQALPFELLVEALKAPRDPSRSALFQVLFILQNAQEQAAFTAPGLTVESLPVPVDTAKFDLTLSFAEEPAGFRGTIEYASDLFDPATIERLAGHLRTLLAAALAAPEAPLGSLSLLTAAEESALAGWQGETVPLPETTVTALIEAQAARTPDGEAARFEGAALSYRALDEAANRLAHLLRARHLALTGRPFAADTPVALRLERGLGMIVAILGVLKAGGAWLPLDLEHPEARLAEMLEDSRAPLTIVGEGGGAGLVALDDPALAAMPATRPEPLGGPDGLAYVIFTSGSTGRPKGVASEHRGLVNRLLWMQDRYPIGPGDRVLQKTPYSFDVSVWEFLWPLLTGATLVFARPGGHRDPGYLARLVAEEAITTLHFVPSMLQAFAERPELPRLTGLRQMFCSGEALPTALAAKVLAALPGLALHNLYGPTEASIDVSWHRCRPEDAAEGAVVPIGRPVWNTELQVLDAALRPLPVGVPGELWLGGVQLARGYLNRPELTAERFVTVAGRRLYRSGDLVRRRPDGALDYLGRADFQVKIRGQRIELGEIEAALEAQPGIRQACVLARGQGGDTLLVAYHDGRPQDPAALRAALAGRLPEAMLPSAFVHLEAFPLTTSGKIDRKALPEPDAPAPQPGRPPAGPLERAIAGIWGEVLGRPVLSAEANFFDLGGTSLGVMRVQTALQALGHGLPVVALFSHPTIAALARHLLGPGEPPPDPLAASRDRAAQRRTLRRRPG